MSDVGGTFTPKLCRFSSRAKVSRALTVTNDNDVTEKWRKKEEESDFLWHQ